MIGVLILSAFGFGYFSGVQVSEGLRITGWVKVSVVRNGEVTYFYESHNLITNQGKDMIAKMVSGGSGSGTGLNPNGANYIALTTDSTAPSATDTSLASEISTNGLQRAQGAWSHTNGTNPFTVSKTFTASGSFTAVQKAGLFNAASGGGMLAANTFSSVNLISGDQITITWTITVA